MSMSIFIERCKKMQITIHLNSGKNITGINLKKAEVESLFSRDVNVIITDNATLFVPTKNIEFIIGDVEKDVD